MTEIYELQRYLIMSMWADEQGREKEKRLLKKPTLFSEKLALGVDSTNDFMDYDKDMIKKAKSALLNFGRVSVPYLMRKLKCDSSYAESVIKEIT